MILFTRRVPSLPQPNEGSGLCSCSRAADHCHIVKPHIWLITICNSRFSAEASHVKSKRLQHHLYAIPLLGWFFINIADHILGCRSFNCECSFIIISDQTLAGLVNSGAPVFDAACPAPADAVRAKGNAPLLSFVWLYLNVRWRMTTHEVTYFNKSDRHKGMTSRVHSVRWTFWTFVQ